MSTASSATIQPGDPSLRLRLMILTGGVALMFLGQFEIFRGVPSQTSPGGLGLLLFGLVLVIAIIGRHRLGSVPDSNAADLADLSTSPPLVRIRPLWLLLSLLLTGWVTWRSVEKPVDAYFGEFVLVWTLAILTLALAIVPGHKQPTSDSRPFLRWEYFALGLLLIGSLAVRGINLGHTPALMDQDEAAFAREGAAFAYQYHMQETPFAQGIYSYAQAYQLLISVSTLIFGKTLFAARLPAMLLGTLGVPAVYLLGRELFNRTVGLLAALFMLGWAYQAIFSRMALNQTGDPVFSALAFYFLLRGLRRRQVVDYFMAGLTLSVAQLSYLGARLTVIVMVVYLLYLLIRQRQNIISQWRLLAVLLLVAFIVAIPQHFWIFYEQTPFTTRLTEKSIFIAPYNQKLSAWDQASRDNQLGPFIVGQIKYSFGGLFTTPDTGGWYGEGSNILGVIGGPLLLIGAMVTLRMWWTRPRWILPLLWGLAVIGSGSILSIRPPAYERYFPGVSAFALLVAVGAWALTLGAAQIVKRSWIRPTVLTVVALMMLFGNLAYFLFDYLPAAGYFSNLNNWRTNRVATEVQVADAAGRYIILVGGYGQVVQNTTVVQYYLAGTRYLDVTGDLSEGLATTDPNAQIDYGRPLTFLVTVERFTDVVQLADDFPGGTLTLAYLPEDHTAAFYIYTVEPSQSHF